MRPICALVRRLPRAVRPAPHRTPVGCAISRHLALALAMLALSILALPGRSPAQVPTFDAPANLDPAAKIDAHGDELPRIASGVGGVWVVVWQVAGATDLNLGRDVDVLYSRSSDDGVHWSAPKPISETFTTDRSEDRQPAVATDGKGNWIVVWTSTQDLQGGSKRDRDIHFVVSSDNALTWSAQKSLNTNAAFDWGDDSSADVATDDKGRWVVVWESTDSLGNTKGGDRDVLFSTSTDNGRNWTPPDVVDQNARTDLGFDAAPRVAVDGMGNWMVAWSSGTASEYTGGFQRGVLVARSSDATASWSPAKSLSGEDEEDRPDFGPRLAADAHGNWICAWASSDTLHDTKGKDRDILFSRSSDGGRTWSTRAPLNQEAATDSGDEDTPELASDNAGNWIAVWTSWDRRGASRGADADLMVAMSRDMGLTWTPSFILNSNAKTDHGEDINPSIATDGAGLWISVWSSTETFGEVLGRDRDILVASGRFGREIAGPPTPGPAK